MKLIDILKSLPVKSVVNYGVLISNADIVNACKLYGQDNREYIASLLVELEKQGELSIVYMKDSGFEDLIIGVKLC